MIALNLIAAILFLTAALTGIAFAIFRAVRTNRSWKIAEPELIAEVEKATGQKVLDKIMMNANDSTDFSRGKGFWLWLAFTSDHIAFADRNRVACNREGDIYFAKRKDVSLKRLSGKFAELEFEDANASERFRFIVLGRARDYELIGRFIATRRN